jgi:hypothetical protein
MTVRETLSKEDTAWIKSYAAEVSKAFGADFSGADNRFNDSKRLLQRFTGAIGSVLANGLAASFPEVDAAHNELCVATALLSNTALHFTTLEYEPVLTGCAKSIDFRATTNDGLILFVDVKTIQPETKDRWDQFEKARKQGWFPENVNVILSKGGLGGELWHNMFAARSRMLEYTLELEAKIRDGKLADDRTIFILALCGEGFHWRHDQLEDFVAFYSGGAHRSDDSFSKAELKDMADRKITLDRTISRFSCMNRCQFDIRQRRLNWHVRPPSSSAFER